MSSIASDYAAEEAARAVTDRRLLKWLRREVNRDLRKWRSIQQADDPGPLSIGDTLADLIADCKAKLVLLGWAESWQRVREPDYLHEDQQRLRAEMISHLKLVMAGVYKLAGGYKSREGWRKEWER